MAGRTSARTAASRNLASSAPRQSTQSPITRRTRTRSASVELDSNARSNVKRGKRSTRQPSVESIESDASVASSNQGGRRTRATRGDIAYPELSIVAEAAEDDEDDENDIDEEEAGNIEGSGRLQQSPGGLSQMSGTTAITSASAQTSHTTAEVAGLDRTMVVEVLPGLWVSSLNLLALLAPANASRELVELTVRELKVPGSKQAKLLKHREDIFKLNKERLGSDDYIRTSFVLQKLFSSRVETGMPRPDAVLQAANLATLVKDLLVSPKEALSTYYFFSNLDTWFPESFVTQFDDNVYYGNSTMLNESFEMALEIRTQYTIVALLHHKSGEQEWHPDEVLTELFFDFPAKRTEQLSHYDDVTKNGQVKNLMRAGPDNTENQNFMVRERVAAIYESFRQSEDAVQAGDLVDFDQLEERFPWSAFLANTAQWTRSRIDEIEESIRQQGGVDNLIESIIEVINSNDSQADLTFEPHPSTMIPRQLLPSPKIVSGTTGHSLFAPNTIRTLEMMKQSSSASTLNQNTRQATTLASASAAASSSNPNPKSTRPRPSRTPATGSMKLPEETRQASDDIRLTLNDNYEEQVEETDLRALSSWEGRERNESKENHNPVVRERNSHRPRFIDAQANARKAQWDTQDSGESPEPVAESSKRKKSTVAPEEESDSHDEGFQADRRDPDPNRRIAVPEASTSRRSGATTVRRSPKRARVQEDEQADQEIEQVAQAAPQRHQRSQPQARTVARRAATQDDFEGDEDDEDDEDPPRPSATQVIAAARIAASLGRQRTAQPQSRTFWSEADTERLIDLIGELGCSWSEIEKAGGFEVERGQVALKDKGRNLKVAFLKGGMPLPMNFDSIALGQKEIRSVRVARPDYEP